MLELLAAAFVATASCALPPNLTPAPVLANEGERRVVPVTSLKLAYYWWPQQCLRPASAATPGCAAGFGFKVHGLWPDGRRGTWPQFCRAATPLAPATVRANYCMTPSTTLLQHEWAKHGTCHWPSAETYFERTRALAATIALPEVERLVTAGAVRDAFVAANPKLPRDAVFVGTDRRQWLTEVRVCMNLDYRPQACDGGRIGARDTVPLRVRPR